MSRKIKTALITGSEGFIGNYLTRLLILKNYKVVGGYYKKKNLIKLIKLNTFIAMLEILTILKESLTNINLV